MSELLPLTRLSPKHKKFADAFLKTDKRKASAIAAGYSEASAAVEANRLLKRPDIQSYLMHEVAKRSASINKVTQHGEALDQRIVAELEAMAFANISDFITVDENGLPQVDFTSATPEQLKAITAIKTKRSTRYDNKGNRVGTDEEAQFTLADKYRGLELLGRHRGLFKSDEQKVVIDVADRLVAARERLMRQGIVDAEATLIAQSDDLDASEDETGDSLGLGGVAPGV